MAAPAMLWHGEQQQPLMLRGNSRGRVGGNIHGTLNKANDGRKAGGIFRRTVGMDRARHELNRTLHTRMACAAAGNFILGSLLRCWLWDMLVWETQA